MAEDWSGGALDDERIPGTGDYTPVAVPVTGI